MNIGAGLWSHKSYTKTDILIHHQNTSFDTVKLLRWLEQHYNCIFIFFFFLNQLVLHWVKTYQSVCSQGATIPAQGLPARARRRQQVWGNSPQSICVMSLVILLVSARRRVTQTRKQQEVTVATNAKIHCWYMHIYVCGHTLLSLKQTHVSFNKQTNLGGSN